MWAQRIIRPIRIWTNGGRSRATKLLDNTPYFRHSDGARKDYWTNLKSSDFKEFRSGLHVLYALRLPR